MRGVALVACLAVSAGFVPIASGHPEDLPLPASHAVVTALVDHVWDETSEGEQRFREILCNYGLNKDPSEPCAG